MLVPRPNAQLSTPSRIPVGSDSPIDRSIIDKNPIIAATPITSAFSLRFSVTVLLSSSTNSFHPLTCPPEISPAEM